MIHAAFFYKETKIKGFRIQGHSHFYQKIKNKIIKIFFKRARHKDYICSAVSAVSFMTVLGLGKVLKKKIVFKEDASGFLECFLEQEPEEKSQILFQSLKKTLEQISRDYPGQIQMKNMTMEDKHGA